MLSGKKSNPKQLNRYNNFEFKLYIIHFKFIAAWDYLGIKINFINILVHNIKFAQVNKYEIKNNQDCNN